MVKRIHREIKPFHESIVDKANKITGNSRKQRERATEIASMISVTKVPTQHVDVVWTALSDMLGRCGGYKDPGFTSRDRSEFQHAFDALEQQRNSDETPDVSASAANGSMSEAEQPTGHA